MVSLLLEFGASISSATTSSPSQFPLGLAAAGGQLEVIATLLRRGAPVDQKDTSGRSALVIAAASGHLEAVELLSSAEFWPCAASLAQSRHQAAVASVACGHDDVSSNIFFKSRIPVACFI